MSAPLTDRVRQRLQEALTPATLEVLDESHLHVGHVGARDGGRHLRVRISSESFRDLRPIARHRAVFEALGDLMTTEIHALAIQAETPSAGDATTD